jgi:Ring finger domain/SWIM zinc finger
MPNEEDPTMDSSITSPAPAAQTKKAAARKPAKKKKDAAPKEEKRLKRFRDACPVALQERLERAATQRLYLIHQSEIPETASSEADSKVDFTVLGSTGNVYQVQFGKVPTCNCPDFHRRQDMCKHIMFILLKVMGLSPNNPLSYQKAYITSELEELFTILRTRRVGGSVLANAQVRAAVLHPSPDTAEAASGVPRRQLTPDDSDCPICFDTLLNEAESKLTYCRGTCGANFHAACLSRWLRSQTAHQSTCPNCRQPWVGAENPNVQPAVGKEAYTNLGALQGQSPARDTSTYHSYSRKKYRRG